MAQDYLGFSVSEKNNVISLRFDSDEYMEIIRNSNAIGVTPVNYLTMLMSPCSICGADKMLISKLTNILNKQFKSAAATHLFCFVNSKLNSGVSETDLKLNYSMSYLLSISDATKIYTPIDRSNHVSKESNATLTLFNNDIKTATFMCKIKNNQIYSLTENI